MTHAPPMFGFSSAEECPAARRHTPLPAGYIERSNWMERKAKTHDQLRCPSCGFWTIWRKRKP